MFQLIDSEVNVFSSFGPYTTAVHPLGEVQYTRPRSRVVRVLIYCTVCALSDLAAASNITKYKYRMYIIIVYYQPQPQQKEEEDRRD